jgi:glutaredoxin
LAGQCAAALALSALMLGVSIEAIAAERSATRENFDHTLTGFPLTGAHSQATCESCHSFGVFKGTPRQCQLCHAPGSGRATTAKPANHVPTAEPCAQCHNSTVTWTGARFRHTGVAPGTCATCHNGAQASGKPPNHVITTSSCDTCHRTTAWLPAGFNHATVVPGTCGSCHNGTTARGKPANHIQTTAACDQCHRTTAWLPATFSHAGVAPGTCATCHNGTTARGKPANHIQTTASCDQCHRTTAWLPATFSHTAVAPGTCATCHNGTQATGKPSGHFVTTRSCDACHTTSAWLPVARYTHTSPYYKAHNTGVTCAACHTTNNEVISWKFSAYKPDCAGCHADRFKPDAHKKVDTPKVLYTVSELRNCSGSCHEYTNTTFTTIKTTRSSKHRSTDGGF